MSERPHIPAKKTLPETTARAIGLAIILSAVLAGANAYLGLFAGMTVSASIPAAVISMAIFKLLKSSNILENNAVQTAASAGESLAAGVIFTFPALVLMGHWDSFNYWETMTIALCGGVLGVLFTIPLRSALIVKQGLLFPEGVATSEVLKSGESGGKSAIYLLAGGVMAALFKLADSGLKLWAGILDVATFIKGKYFAYFGMNLSPALVAVGYIVGLNIAVLVFIGGAISWWIAIPIYLYMNPEVANSGTAVEVGYQVWSSQIRYLGVGAMVVGGIWALVSIRSALASALAEGLKALTKKAKRQGPVSRTEKDMPFGWVMAGILLLILPIGFIYWYETLLPHISFTMSVIMVIAGFLFSAVAGYMAGLVGSSNNPISGVTIATILFSSFLLLLLMGPGASNGAPAAILVGAVVCCAAAIAGDNMQDLKAGHILGSTPYRQQIMQMVGVVAAALVIPLIMDLLNSAYGFGPKTPEQPDALPAPQATLMKSVAVGVFGGDLPWNMIVAGGAIGVWLILIDKMLEAKGSSFRVPVLAVAVGLYLPFELDSAIMLGGLLSYITNKLRQQRFSEDGVMAARQNGLLFASGLITGEALMGILLAVQIVLAGSGSALALAAQPFGAYPGLAALLLILAWMVYKTAIKHQTDK